MYLVSELQRDRFIAALKAAPLDADRPLELIIREKQKIRGLDHNARMWAGPLRDIAEQAFCENKQYSAEVWHEYFKKEFLPEEHDPELTKEGYKKWDFMPDGSRVLIGSTSQLTRYGFSQHLLQIEAFGAALGVKFSAPKNQEI